MSQHWRFYLAGVLHTAGGLWIACWALSFGVDSLRPVFGPTGWLPVSLGLTLVLLAIPLLLRSPAPSPDPLDSGEAIPNREGH